jgi:hypothetical protein
MPDFPFAAEKVGNFCRKCCGIENVVLTYTAGGSDGHCCDAALFNLYIYIDPSQRVLMGQINLNNQSTCEEKTGSQTITSKMIEDMTKNLDSDICCKFSAKLDCDPSNDSPYFGPGNCHPNLARLVVTKDGLVDPIYQGNVGEGAVEIDACSLVP